MFGPYSKTDAMFLEQFEARPRQQVEKVARATAENDQGKNDDDNAESAGLPNDDFKNTPVLHPKRDSDEEQAEPAAFRNDDSKDKEMNEHDDSDKAESDDTHAAPLRPCSEECGNTIPVMAASQAQETNIGHNNLGAMQKEGNADDNALSDLTPLRHSKGVHCRPTNLHISMKSASRLASTNRMNHYFFDFGDM